MERHASRDRGAAPVIDELGQVEQSHHTLAYQIVRDRAVPLRFKLLRGTHRGDGQHGKNEEQSTRPRKIERWRHALHIGS